ncbi:MAG TPA: metallophosphoesterase [Cyclobacteriaceae bacterium]
MRTQKLMMVFVFALIFLAIDYYVFQAVLLVSKSWTEVWRIGFRYAFWIPTLLCVLALFWWAFDNPYVYSANFRNWVITGIVTVYFSKIFAVLFLFAEDVQRGVRYVLSLFNENKPEGLPGEPITRSQFMSQAALVAAAVPFGAFTYGIISGAHDYRVKRLTVKLPNLPKSFDGMSIGQISDIHSGSFFNKTAVKGGVEMLMKEKPDVIFFTGDLVNNESAEVKDYIDVFSKVKAPLGVYSVTGNHDYGDYHKWESADAKAQNFQDLIRAHHELGFDLLLNEHRWLEENGDKIAIIGNENWGAGRFSKYGKLDQAYAGTEEAAVKLLLSHDPSHWDAQVRKEYQDINVTFAGHTHGFQFGVEIGGFKWSPSQYVYRQWAGLYSEGNQHLYVNRGFGFIGYPGRVGIPPELTILTLKRA